MDILPCVKTIYQMKNAHAKNRGFTLIELMVVLAIVGLLASIALPQYQAYVSRAQATRVVAEVAALKTAVENCVIEGRTGGLGAGELQCDPGASGSSLMTVPAANGAAPTLTGLPLGTGVPEVTFPLSGGQVAVMKATFGNSAALILAGQSVTWQRSATGSWTCITNISASYKPVQCS